MNPLLAALAMSIAALVSIAFPAGAQAGERAFAPEQVAALPPGAIITLDNVEALLREMGFAPRRVVRDDVIALVFEMEGRQAFVMLRGCVAEGCKHLQIRAVFTTPRPTTLKTIAAWNRAGTPLTALLDADGDPAVASDVVLTGASIATIRAWIEIWREQMPRFLAHLTK